MVAILLNSSAQKRHLWAGLWGSAWCTWWCWQSALGQCLKRSSQAGHAIHGGATRLRSRPVQWATTRPDRTTTPGDRRSRSRPGPRGHSEIHTHWWGTQGQGLCDVQSSTIDCIVRRGRSCFLVVRPNTKSC